MTVEHTSTTAQVGAGQEIEYCQPMDCGKPTPRKFILMFDDPDHGTMHFDNEAEARKAFEGKNAAWNCYLFAALPRHPATGFGVGQEKVVPVAWRTPMRSSGQYQLTSHADVADRWRDSGVSVQPLYAHPPQPGSGADHGQCAPDYHAHLTAELLRLKNRIDTICNNVLCDMRPGWDDSIEGFNKAWDVVRDIMQEEIGRSTQKALAESNRSPAENSEEIAVLEKELTRLRNENSQLAGQVERARPLLKVANLLFQNAVGCAEQHHGIDITANGLPGWLRDLKAELDAASAALPSTACRGLNNEG